MSSTTPETASTYTPTPRLAANRANAQHSTGPRTPEGKSRSAQNATSPATHLLFNPTLPLPGESEPLFHALRDAFLHDLDPRSAPELALVDRAVSLVWRLRRAQAADLNLNLMQQADTHQQLREHNEELQAAIARRQQYQSDDANNADDDLPHPERAHDDARIATGPLAEPPADHPLDPAFLLARALHTRAADPATGTTRTAAAHTTPTERLLSTESRLDTLLHRTLRQLRQLQADRREKHPDSDQSPNPFLPPPTHQDTDHTEETDTPKVRSASADVPPTPQPPSPEKNHPNEPKSHPDTPLSTPQTLLDHAQSRAVEAILNRKRGVHLP